MITFNSQRYEVKRNPIEYNTGELLNRGTVPASVKKLSGGAIIKLPVNEIEMEILEAVEVENMLSDDELVDFLERYTAEIRNSKSE